MSLLDPAEQAPIPNGCRTPGVASWAEQDSLAEQVETGSAVHLLLDHLDPVDVVEVFRVAADPAGYLPHRLWLDNFGQVRAGVVLLDEGADDAVSAGEALRGDFAMQGRGLASTEPGNQAKPLPGKK